MTFLKNKKIPPLLSPLFGPHYLHLWFLSPPRIGEVSWLRHLSPGWRGGLSWTTSLCVTLPLISLYEDGIRLFLSGFLLQHDIPEAFQSIEIRDRGGGPKNIIIFVLSTWKCHYVMLSCCHDDIMTSISWSHCHDGYVMMSMSAVMMLCYHDIMLSCSHDVMLSCSHDVMLSWCHVVMYVVMLSCCHVCCHDVMFSL